MSAASIFLVVSAVLCVVLSIYGRLQRQDAFTTYYAGLMLASATYAFGYGLELAAPSLEYMKRMLQLQYLGIPFLSLTWLGMAWAYLNPGGLERRYLVMLLVPCLVTLIVFQTNDAHRLFYTSLELVRKEGLSIAVSGKGPLYWLHIAYLNLCIATGILLFVRAWRQSMRIYRSQALCVLLGSLLPWAFHLLYLAGLSPQGMDLGPFGLAISGVLFAVASFQHGIFGIRPVARDLVFDGISEGVIVLDNQDRVSDFNRAAARYVEGLTELCVGKILHEIAGAKAIADELSQQGGNPTLEGASGVEVCLARDTLARTYEVRMSAMYDRSGVIQCKALVLLDVSEKKQLLELLQRQAQTDSLTGLLNRRQLEAEARRLMQLSKRNGRPLSLVIIDVDHFKTINDAQGHAAGDLVLQRLSALLHRRLRSSDVAGRLGGDEFVVVLPETGAADAAALMQALKEMLAKEEAVTLSIGVAELSSEHGDLKSLLASADRCLYDAKQAGRGRVVFAGGANDPAVPSLPDVKAPCSPFSMPL